jgi:hypothetical protein
MGLTDRRVATDGTIYIRHYGKTYPVYTYRVVRPQLIIVQNRLGHLQHLADASEGHFNETYSTYSLEKIAGCSADVLMSVRTDVESRILTAFSGVELKRVAVPFTPRSK